MTKRTKDEQAHWDRIFEAAYERCQKGRRADPVGCARLAEEEADACLAARRHSQANGRK